MSDPFVAEIRIFPFNFAPKGWAFCDGQILPISQNTALFSLLGTTYGGDGKSNFALPNLQGRAPMFYQQGPGLSLYDLGQVRPPIVLRRGAAGESYEGIRKGPVHIDGRPVLVDRVGPFGNPTSDSARTMITTATTQALVVVYAPAAYNSTRLGAVQGGTSELLRRHCGGTEVLRKTIG